MSGVCKGPGNGGKGEKVQVTPSLSGVSTFFNLMVYSADGIPGKEAVAAQQHLASLHINKLKREYLEMCGFVRSQMSVPIVRSNTLLILGTRDKEAYILQRPDMVDGSVMALLAP